MVEQPHKHNAHHLAADLAWFRQIVEVRYRRQHKKVCRSERAIELPPPALNGHPSIYQRCIDGFELTWQERWVLLLALVPQIQPHLLDEIAGSSEATAGNGIDDPTIETALYVLAGDDLERRFHIARMFEPDSLLIREHVLDIEPDPARPSQRNQARIRVSPDFLALFTTGSEYRPAFDEAFPARLVRTGQRWDDLVLNAKTSTQIDEIRSWAAHGEMLLEEWGLGRRFSPGYTSLFYGPPGTGKTMTAGLLGKSAGLDVYLVDMSMVVSRYVGDTSKNLGRIFDVARNKPWLLFFDECESCFSKRTETVKDAHDRWSNQEISYLLQRIEDHPGICILATNMKQHVDDAFLRRFQSVIEFPTPTAAERLRIWQGGFSTCSKLDPAIDLARIAGKYEMAGGSIMNVIRYASLMALERGGSTIHRDDLIRGIRREFEKEGRSA